MHRPHSVLMPHRVANTVLTVMDSRYDELKEAMLVAVGRFVAEIHFHDDSTGTHVESIGVVAGVIGRVMAARGLIDDWTAEWVERVAPLHGVGKLDVPSAVLNKRFSLDAEHWEVIRQHPTIGRQRITGVLSRMVDAGRLDPHCLESLRQSVDELDELAARTGR